MRHKLFTAALTAALSLGVIGAALADSDRAVDKLHFPGLNKLIVPEVDKRTLSNGIAVYVVEDHMLPTFNVSVRIAAGSYLEPSDKVGLASILGDVMRTGGTNKWTGDEIDAALEGVGATVETNMGITSGNAFGNSLIEYADLTLEVLAEVLQHPTFDPDKIDITKTQFRGTISRRNDNPMQVSSRILSAAIYGDESPYARWAEYATVDAVTRDDLLAFHKEYIHPANIQIAVWGDFKADDMFKKLEKHFGSWRAAGSKAPAPPDVDQPMQNRIKYAEKTDVNQSNIYIGHLGGKVQDEDYPTRLVMNNIFGGGFGSRLFSNVRTREGLAYATGGGFGSNVEYPGRFLGFVSTKSESTVKAMREVIKQMESMKTVPPSDEEMRLAIDGYLNSFVFNFDTRSEVVNRMVQYDAYGLPLDFLSQVKEKVEKVTPADVQAAAQKHFQLDKLYMVVVGKGEDFDESLDVFGVPIDTVDITIPSGEPETDLDMSEANINKGKQLLAAAAEACGGAAAFAGVSGYKASGGFDVSAGGQMMSMQAEVLMLIPDKRLLNLKTPMGAMASGVDGAQGWRAMGGRVMDLSEAEVADEKMQTARDFVSIFATLGANDWTPVYAGGGDVNGEGVEWVHLITSDGDELTRVAISSASKMPVALSHLGNLPTGPTRLTVLLSDFRDVNGLKIPFTRISQADGETVQQITYESFEVNPTVDATTFA
ncbi:MAG TPA: pitrilysin family protein, partial [candidate division Zixibacteria bacterium]|nr:pitrilysin family protein [candidate division Zixibacteria bacterium]